MVRNARNVELEARIDRRMLDMTRSERGRHWGELHLDLEVVDLSTTCDPRAVEICRG